MGMYTELVIGFHTQNQELIDFCKYLVEDNEGTKYGDRRDWMLKSSSYYFPCAESFSKIKSDSRHNTHISIRCSLKNYDAEIEWFVDEVRRMLEPEYRLLGYKRYEEATMPTLIYHHKDYIVPYDSSCENILE